MHPLATTLCNPVPDIVDYRVFTWWYARDLCECYWKGWTRGKTFTSMTTAIHNAVLQMDRLESSADALQILAWLVTLRKSESTFKFVDLLSETELKASKDP